ncbi:hypothetical protein [Cytobacillus praedii]|nr:hypothetical protein [Cytobacillus praedii]
MYKSGWTICVYEYHLLIEEAVNYKIERKEVERTPADFQLSQQVFLCLK